MIAAASVTKAAAATRTILDAEHGMEYSIKNIIRETPTRVKCFATGMRYCVVPPIGHKIAPPFDYGRYTRASRSAVDDEIHASSCATGLISCPSSHRKKTDVACNRNL